SIRSTDDLALLGSSVRHPRWETDKNVDRSVLAGIGASVALAVGCVGMFVLTPEHHASAGRPSSASLAGSLPGPTTLSPSPQASSPSPSHKPTPKATHKHHSHPSPSPHKLPNVISGHVFVGVAVKSGIVSGVRSFHQATG